MTKIHKFSFQDGGRSVLDSEFDKIVELELSNGHKAYIIDGIFDQPMAEKLHKHYSSYPFKFTEFDRDDTKMRHLVSYLSDEEIADPKRNGGLIDLTLGVLDHLGLKHNGHVNRAYVNFILYGDFQYAHEDGNEWTGLVFIANEWDEDWMGEFYINDPDGVLKFAVTPKPGRMIIFDGRIVHRGGVPSRQCIHPRLTLAIKIGRP